MPGEPRVDRPPRLSSREVDAAIERLAARQHATFARTQLLAAGVSPAAIDERVSRGRLIVLHRGVYLVASPVVPELAEEMGAQLAAGRSAAVGYVAAARIRGLDLPKRLLAQPRVPVDVIVPGRHRRQRERLRIHSDSIQLSAETTKIGPLRVTTASRTILDLAPSLSDRELEQLIAHATRNRLVRRRDLELQLARSRNRAGVPRLRRALGGPLRMVRSVREDALVQLLDTAGLPPPTTNVKVEGRELDVYWPEERVGIELQSRAHHSDEVALEADSEKASLLTALGYSILPFTPRQVEVQPALVIARTRAALSVARARAARERDSHEVDPVMPGEPRADR